MFSFIAATNSGGLVKLIIARNKSLRSLRFFAVELRKEEQLLLGGQLRKYDLLEVIGRGLRGKLV